MSVLTNETLSEWKNGEDLKRIKKENLTILQAVGCEENMLSTNKISHSVRFVRASYQALEDLIINCNLRVLQIAKSFANFHAFEFKKQLKKMDFVSVTNLDEGET
ncbi:CLUMA_CG021558, isoform A [Clunio marinus]|uniref:CLUMA_CG021558, isoform A n=1 Tax=Clunio marinus TaxID=568069 RepID=A0A1J1J8I2_9DIPT|nr:CLUMA_CG021558, isoform A [Clunio marinus]